MNIGDCFIMKGSSIYEPMTIYHITDIEEDKLWALSVFIDETMVQGLDYPREYDYDIPEDAVLLPSGTYDRVKNAMNDFLIEIENYVKDNCIDGEFSIEIGCHYYDGYIHTVQGFADNRVIYKLFRLENENISPDWSGDCTFDSIYNHCKPITEETYQEVLKRYNLFKTNLKKSLYL